MPDCSSTTIGSAPNSRRIRVALHVGAAFDERLRKLHVTPRYRDGEGVLVRLVPRVDVDSRIEELYDRLDVATPRGREQIGPWSCPGCARLPGRLGSDGLGGAPTRPEKRSEGKRDRTKRNEAKRGWPVHWSEYTTRGADTRGVAARNPRPYAILPCANRRAGLHSAREIL